MIDRKVYLIPLNRDWETERRRERAWSKSMGRDGGVFGSLLVQLPAQHEGGDLVIIHMGAARRIHTAAESADACYYTAFYAGCLHSPQPVTSGLRLVLTFDLLLTPVEGVLIARPTAPVPAEDKTARLMSALQSWICDTDNAPKRLCARLENSSNFMSKNRTLGGSDRQMVNALKALVDPHTQEPLLQVRLVEISSGTWCEGRFGQSDLMDLDMEQAWMDEYGRHFVGNRTFSDSCLDVDSEEYLDEKDEERIIDAMCPGSGSWEKSSTAPYPDQTYHSNYCLARTTAWGWSSGPGRPALHTWLRGEDEPPPPLHQ